MREKRFRGTDLQKQLLIGHALDDAGVNPSDTRLRISIRRPYRRHWCRGNELGQTTEEK